MFGISMVTTTKLKWLSSPNPATPSCGRTRPFGGPTPSGCLGPPGPQRVGRFSGCPAQRPDRPKGRGTPQGPLAASNLRFEKSQWSETDRTRLAFVLGKMTYRPFGDPDMRCSNRTHCSFCHPPSQRGENLNLNSWMHLHSAEAALTNLRSLNDSDRGPSAPLRARFDAANGPPVPRARLRHFEICLSGSGTYTSAEDEARIQQDWQALLAAIRNGRHGVSFRLVGENGVGMLEAALLEARRSLLDRFPGQRKPALEVAAGLRRD